MGYFKQRLFWKFFFSYFVLILISIVVLGVLIRILLPGTFNNQLANMSGLFARYGMEEGGHMGTGGRGFRMMGGSVFFRDLFAIFNQIILEAMLYAIGCDRAGRQCDHEPSIRPSAARDDSSR